MFCFTFKKTMLFVFVFLLLPMVAQPVFAKDEVRHTRHNVHTQNKNGKTYKASYANYTNPGQRHVINLFQCSSLLIG